MGLKAQQMPPAVQFLSVNHSSVRPAGVKPKQPRGKDTSPVTSRLETVLPGCPVFLQSLGLGGAGLNSKQLLTLHLVRPSGEI